MNYTTTLTKEELDALSETLEFLRYEKTQAQEAEYYTKMERLYKQLVKVYDNVKL